MYIMYICKDDGSLSGRSMYELEWSDFLVHCIGCFFQLGEVCSSTCFTAENTPMQKKSWFKAQTNHKQNMTKWNQMGKSWHFISYLTIDPHEN